MYDDDDDDVYVATCRLFTMSSRDSVAMVTRRKNPDVHSVSVMYSSAVHLCSSMTSDLSSAARSKCRTTIGGWRTGAMNSLSNKKQSTYSITVHYML